MRVIAISTLKKFWYKNKDSEQSLKSWYQEVGKANWKNSGELKAKYKSASIITARRVVFNIKGNSYRLIVDVEYRLQIIFIVWIGTHNEYDKVDAKNVKYVKTNKK